MKTAKAVKREIDLSILCVTRGEREVMLLLHELAKQAQRLGAEFVIAVDGGDDAWSKFVNFPCDVLQRVESRGYIESVLDEAVAATSRKYVLRVDDDESLSPGLVNWLASLAYRDAPNWKFARAHLIGDATQYIDNLPLWADHQTRLSIRAQAGGRGHIHSGSPFGGGRLSPGVLLHHKFVIKTLEQRREISDRYERLQTGAGKGFWCFSTPEDEMSRWTVRPIEDAYMQAREAAQEERIALALDRARAIGMHQHAGEIEPFARWIAERRPHNVVEIGTLHGGTAALWHGIATGTVVSIDLPNGRFGGADHNLDLARVEERNARLMAEFPRLRCIVGDSSNVDTVKQVIAALVFDADLVFIDGDHTYEGARLDYINYRQMVRPGGVVAFHDVLDTPIHRAAGCEVDRLWGELIATEPYQLFSIDGPWGGIGVIVVVEHQ